MYAHHFAGGRWHVWAPVPEASLFLKPLPKENAGLTAGASFQSAAMSVTVCVLIATEIGLMAAEARIIARERLLHVFTPTLGHVLSIAHALLADFIGPLAEGFVLAARPRQERADQQAGREADDADDHRIFRHVVLNA